MNDKVLGWLVQFEYEEYCQGYEWTWTYRLVYARTFEEACNKIKASSGFRNPRDFMDCTIL